MSSFGISGPGEKIKFILGAIKYLLIVQVTGKEMLYTFEYYKKSDNEFFDKYTHYKFKIR